MSTEAVWEQFRSELLAFIRRRVRQEADAEDILQKVFLNLHRHLSTGAMPEHLRGWLYQITRNAVTDALRSGGRPGAELNDATGAIAEAPEADDEASKHLARCLGGMIEGLPEDSRQALTWTELQGLTQVEAAQRAGVSLSGMKSRVQRGREKLREALLACCAVQLDARNRPMDYQCRKPGDCGGCA